MRALVLDCEVKVEFILEEETNKKITDGSPFNPNNKLVTVHWANVDTDTLTISPTNHSTYFHNDYSGSDSPATLQHEIDQAEVIIAHNAKFDVMWLMESGFDLSNKQIWCTMIGEYVLARGTIVPLSLKETAIRRGTSLKKSDLVEELFNSGVGYEAIPLETVWEYGDADVVSCAEIFLQQFTEFQDVTQTRRLRNIITLMNEMLLFLVEIERNGVCIDLDTLKKVGEDYQQERSKLLLELKDIVEQVMGDEPINVDSGADISKVIYSRVVKDRDLHQRTFNIGLDQHGRKQYPPRMKQWEFEAAVRLTTKVLERKRAVNCPVCNGNAFIRKIRKDGTPFKNTQRCKACEARGFLLLGTGTVAGFKLTPDSPRDASINGFKAGSDELDRLIDQAKRKDNLQAVEFLTKKKRLNVINTYLNSFVIGIQRWTRENNLLHSNFNQCVARTGRLSSSNPNFQNQPKGRKFPVRKAIVSRWQGQGGLILEADFSGLEFVVAGELSRDQQIIDDILMGKDVHGQTAGIVTQQPDPTINWKDKDHKDIRNENKPYTFAPLYGGQGANEPPHIQRYFQEFFKIYKGHELWQFDQMDHVIKYGYIAVPSGREYTFPGTRRLRGRRTSNATNIVNYPVQGFATGDIVPLACIRALRAFRKMGLRSLLILTVHDSIVVDVYPDELEQVSEALIWAMTAIDEEIKERWEYECVLPFKCEIAHGTNWMDME